MRRLSLLAAGISGALLAAGCTDSAEIANDTPLTTSPAAETTTADDPATSSTATSSTLTADADNASEPDAGATAGPSPFTGELTATVIATHPHDPAAFTQGLEVFGGRFIEGTGLYGESDRRIVKIESGEPAIVVPIDADLFGEGLTIVGDQVLQLTWKAGVLIRSDASTLEEIGRDTYEGEGWGLCFDGTELAMSNGSSSLTFRDPATLAANRTVAVTLDGEPVERLNELECVNGQVFANVWLSDLIVVIDPQTGNVDATLDGSSLRPEGFPLEESSFALNGIAYDSTTGRFFLTGKLWPVLYEVELS